MPAPSQSYSHDAGLWHFGTTPDSGASATSNHYTAFGQTLPGIGLPSTGENGLSLNMQDGDGRTQLHRAVINGSEEPVRTLLSTGAAVDLKDHAGNQPLHYAVLGNSVSIVELLLKFGADFDSKGQAGRSPLHMSVPFIRILKILLKAQATVSCQDEKGDTPLHLALSPATLTLSFNESVTQPLLEACADPNIANMAGITPFNMVVDQLYRETGWHDYLDLRRFLEFGADISLRTRDNKLPFEIFLDKSNGAWAKKESSCFRLFLSKGADPDTRLRSGELLLHHFLQRYFGEYDTCDDLAELLCRSVDLSKIGEKGRYLLHELSALGRVRYRPQTPTLVANLIKIVLNRGADPNQLDRSGRSPLMTLLTTNTNCKDEVARAVKALLAAGADPMLRDPLGNLSLYEAARNFPKAARELGKVLLLADVSLGDDVRKHRHDGNSMDDNLWWQNWELAIRDVDWDRAKTRLCDSKDSLPADVGKRVCLLALGVLAERQLEMAKDKFTMESSSQSSLLDYHRSNIAVILRDCRKMEVEVHPKWLDYLLNLCK